MTLIVEHLTLRTRDVDRFGIQFTILTHSGTLLSEIEYSRVSSLGNLPFHLEDEVLELVGENDITAFAFASAIEVQATILHIPLVGHVILLVTTPAIQALAVEENIIAVLID